jgi:hypothetical protein
VRERAREAWNIRILIFNGNEGRKINIHSCSADIEKSSIIIHTKINFSRFGDDISFIKK